MRIIKFGSESPNWKGGKIIRNCLTCNKEFYVDPNVVKSGNGKFCSRSCTGKRKYGHKKSAKIPLICIVCQKIFYDYISRLLKDKTRGKCCSVKCRIEYTKSRISGENNYRWKGGLTSLNTLQRSQMITRKWSRLVKERDNFTCQKCGIRSHKGLGKAVILNSHHKKAWKDHPELRWDVSNGITLCKDCHKQEHSKK